MGRLADVEDFNAWLGEQPHAHKLVVFGNHEYNAPWKGRAAELLSNAIFLCDSSIMLDVAGARRPLSVHGTNFAWPMKTTNPHYDQVGAGSADVLVCHGPVAGYADGGKGCTELWRLVRRLKPRLVASGHIHFAHGVAEGRFDLTGATFVNAANAGAGSHT
eukprot:189873-Prymnesium_polylepis.1